MLRIVILNMGTVLWILMLSACSLTGKMTQEAEIMAIYRVELTEKKSDGNAPSQPEAKIIHIETQDSRIGIAPAEPSPAPEKSEESLIASNHTNLQASDSQSQPSIPDTDEVDEADDSDSKDEAPNIKRHPSYSKKTRIKLDGTENKELFTAVDKWIGTPYRYGGCSKSGVDCSCLVRMIYKAVYGIDLPRTSGNIVKSEVARVQKEDLQEGDIVFFKTKGDRISHVGIYLKDNKFVHASRKRGVVINDLDEAYYERKYLSAVRIEGKNHEKGRIIEIALNKKSDHDKESEQIKRKGKTSKSSVGRRIVLKEMTML